MEINTIRNLTLFQTLRSKLYLIYIPILACVFLNIALNRANHFPRTHIIWSDTEGYYMYLPALFIIKDVHKVPSGSVLPQLNEKGEHVIKYTCGVAMMELPFFLIAKWYCQIKSCDWTDYFNIHYVRAMALCGYFYGFLGLFFLAGALRRRFSEAITFWTILSVFLGTNLFHYMTRSMAMSHAYSFCLFAFIVWFTPVIYRKPTLLKAILLGLIMGLNILTRPTNAIILVFILLYDVYRVEELKVRLRFLLAHWPKIFVAVVASSMVFIPQLIYWYEMTGKVIRYSYENEGFIYWLKPKIAAVLFDTQNGLFLYSPMALLMVIGIIIGLKGKQYQGISLAVIFCVITYLFASWWAWWFGGAFGHRSYVEFYALFAIPLAGLYERVIQHKGFLLKIIMFLVSGFFMFYSVKMSMLHSYLPGPWDGADWRWNWEKIEWVWSYLFKPLH